MTQHCLVINAAEVAMELLLLLSVVSLRTALMAAYA